MAVGARPGHRARLRQRFVAGGPRAFLDHEVLEMLLAQVEQRRDTKPRAYALIDAAGAPLAGTDMRPALGRQLAAVLLQSPEWFTSGKVDGVGPAMSIHLAAVRSAAARIAEAVLLDAPVLGNWEAVVSYSQVRFTGSAKPQVYALFLDYRHRLMREPEPFDPSTDAKEFARLVLSTALRRAASGLIIIRHNPDGFTTPQAHDFARADELKAAGAVNAVLLHDYMLVCATGTVSLRSIGVMEIAPAYEALSAVESIFPMVQVDDWYAHSRERLDSLQKYAEAEGVDALDDEALLALLLRRAVGDEERLAFARRLIAHFGNLGRTLSAPFEELVDAVSLLPESGRPESPDVLAVHLGVIAEATQRLLRGQVLTQPLLDKPGSLIAYCRAALGYQEVEQLRVLFLDNAGRLIWDEMVSRGTVNHAPVQPREIAARALRLNAASIVLVHNHPTGDAEASLSDIDITRQIVEACRAVGIAVLDHLIIAQSGHTSLADAGKIPQARSESGRPLQRRRKRA
jgi:DNA repair protein RadC